MDRGEVYALGSLLFVLFSIRDSVITFDYELVSVSSWESEGEGGRARGAGQGREFPVNTRCLPKVRTRYWDMGTYEG